MKLPGVPPRGGTGNALAVTVFKSMMNLNIKTLDRICLGLVVLISFGCGYWVVNRAVKEQRRIHLENEIISKGLVELRSVEENFEHFNALLENTKRELESLEKRIPESANIGEVLREVDALMKERKVLLLSLQPLPTVEEKLYTKIPIRLLFKGSFINIYHLLYDLETMNRMLVTERMSITRSSLDETCQAELIASVFQR